MKTRKKKMQGLHALHNKTKNRGFTDAVAKLFPFLFLP